MAGIEEWRLQPPKATLREIEVAVDARLAELRTRMLQDVALASPAADLSGANAQDRPVCPQCGTPVKPRGPRERQVTTDQGKPPALAAQLCGVPDLSGRAFPPWMRSWRCCRGS